jgi:MoxR-like ATPase
VSDADRTPPDLSDLRGIARSLRELLKIGARTMAEEAGPSELAQRVGGHLEQHIIGVAGWSRELLDAGQHLKRGLLLHGPPGTGKTHTVRYLTARLAGSTVILLTGRSIRFIDAAAALARRLQPSMVVLEDVDLVATDRDYTPDGNPLLFSLLDAMDGIGAGPGEPPASPGPPVPVRYRRVR